MNGQLPCIDTGSPGFRSGMPTGLAVNRASDGKLIKALLIDQTQQGESIMDVSVLCTSDDEEVKNLP